jgi:hypothetical protein
MYFRARLDGGTRLTRPPDDTTYEDLITLTLPRDEGVVSVARIVVGGVAARLNLPYETLDDLQLAVESVLAEDRYWARDEATVELAVGDRALGIAIGPVSSRVKLDLSASQEIGLAVVLRSVVDSVALEDRDGTRWIRMERRVPAAPRG